MNIEREEMAHSTIVVLQLCRSCLKGLSKFRRLGSLPRVSELAGLGGDPCVSLSDKFPGAVVAADLGPHGEL